MNSDKIVSILLHMFYEEMQIRRGLHGLENEVLKDESLINAAARSKAFRTGNRAIFERRFEELFDIVDSFHAVIQLNFHFPQRMIGPVYAWDKQVAREEICNVVEIIQPKPKHYSEMKFSVSERETSSALEKNMNFAEQQPLKRLYGLFHATGCLLKIEIVDPHLARIYAKQKMNA
jgi:hypothetical protein